MSDNPARHLSNAAEEIRAFAHESQSTKEDWLYPSHAYTAVGNLSYLAGMLGQVVEQSTTPVREAYEKGYLHISGSRDPEAKFAELVAAREDALAAAAALTAAVQRMHNAVSPMEYDDGSDA
ncbi:hypothetical protein ACWCPT_29435 [Streptomyces sp. NPDC002308]